MLSKGFKIVSPKTFEVFVENISADQSEAIVKIDTAAICKADLRYYTGNRDKRVLGLKYPMRLIHEAIGTVINDNSKVLKKGQKVMLVPNIKFNYLCEECALDICHDNSLGENYCPKAKFASSNYEGFSSEFITYPSENLVPINNVEDEVAVFAEVISVCNAAIRRVGNLDDKVIGIWGDGIVGYILALVIKSRFNCRVICVGKNIDKLKKIICDEYYVKDSKDMLSSKIDIAFECVGGQKSQDAINEIIYKIKPGGKIVLTGVAENNVQINTRKILEKGISITGSTRSNVEDFMLCIELFKSKKFVNGIKEVILSVNEVSSINEYYNVFEVESNNRLLGKHIMKFNI